MRYYEISESKWWDDEPTVLLYHGTSSVFVPDIKTKGLAPPEEDLRAFAERVLEAYVPRDQWTPEFLAEVTPHVSVMRESLVRSGNRGAVLYFFTDPEAVEGYAKSYAEHGGEIAYEVYLAVNIALAREDITWAELKADPVVRPRFADTGKPVVIEVEVPKSWCLTDIDFDDYRTRLSRAWDEGKSFARRFATREEFFADAFENREVRVRNAIRPDQIKSIRFI